MIAKDKGYAPREVERNMLEVARTEAQLAHAQATDDLRQAVAAGATEVEAAPFRKAIDKATAAVRDLYPA